ncbi:FMN-linked oxidoreductase, partial [Hesseltinella vesiculosa]
QFLELLHIISGDRHCYYSEMHHAQAVLNHRSHLHRFIGKPRDNVVVQLGGNCPVTIAQAVQVLEDGGFAEVNINVGCPSPNVQHGQFGAVLMKAPVLVADILSSINASIPVTVKCRVGVDHLDSFEFFENFVDTLLNCQRPPPHLIVHARKCILKGLSPKQNRMIPPLNYSRVYKLASARSDLPITINGGFTTVKDIQAALEVVDGCMIGRQVMLKPLFLQEIDQRNMFTSKLEYTYYYFSSSDIYNVPKVRLKSPMEVIKQYTGKIKGKALNC